MVCVRWQNGVPVVLAAFRLVVGGVEEGIGLCLSLVLFCSLVSSSGLSPQLLAWKAIYGDYLLLDPPHGAQFVDYLRPFFLETLFSSRHGLLSWTPLLWLGFVGLIPAAEEALDNGLDDDLLFASYDVRQHVHHGLVGR